MESCFQNGETEIEYLGKAGRKLAEVIGKAGALRSKIFPDLFSVPVNPLTGQPRSTKARQTILERMKLKSGGISPAAIRNLPPDELQKVDSMFKKTDDIRSAAQKFISGGFAVRELKSLSDK